MADIDTKRVIEIDFAGGEIRQCPAKIQRIGRYCVSLAEIDDRQYRFTYSLSINGSRMGWAFAFNSLAKTPG